MPYLSALAALSTVGSTQLPPFCSLSEAGRLPTQGSPNHRAVSAFEDLEFFFISFTEERQTINPLGVLLGVPPSGELISVMYSQFHRLHPETPSCRTNREWDGGPKTPPSGAPRTLVEGKIPVNSRRCDGRTEGPVQRAPTNTSSRALLRGIWVLLTQRSGPCNFCLKTMSALLLQERGCSHSPSWF